MQEKDKELCAVAVVQQCMNFPFGYSAESEIFKGLIADFDAAESEFEEARFISKLRSLGATPRSEYKEMPDEYLMRIVARGVFLYESMVADCLTVLYTALDFTNDEWDRKKKVSEQLRLYARKYTGINGLLIVNPSDVPGDAFYRSCEKKSLLWLTNFIEFEDVKMFDSVVSGVTLGINLSEGDFCISPRFQGVKRSALTGCVQRSITAMQLSFDFIFNLADEILSQLNKTLDLFDQSGASTDPMGDPEFGSLYQHVCQICDSFTPLFSAPKYDVQTWKNGMWLLEETLHGNPYAWSERHVRPHVFALKGSRLSRMDGVLIPTPSTSRLVRRSTEAWLN